VGEIERITGFPNGQAEGCSAVRVRKDGSDGRADGAAASDLAEWTEGADFLAGMQVRRPLAPRFANLGGCLMVVKNFNRKEVNFPRQRQAGDECMHPVSVPRFAEPSQVDRSAVFWAPPRFLRTART
jgi:hypothetical protein